MTAPGRHELPGLVLTLGDRWAEVQLDRPPLNVLDLALLASLNQAVEQLAAWPDLALVLVSGAGPKGFSAGVSVQDHTADKIETMLATFHRACQGLAALPALSVAAVHGVCLGGGMELAASCDLVVATESAVFGQPEIELGCFPPLAAAVYPARYGHGWTLDLLVTGRRVSAAEAERRGFVTRLVADDTFGAELASLREAVLAKSGAVVRLTRRAVALGTSLPPSAAIAACERLYLEELAPTADMTEGLEAFLTKRRPVWRHR